MSLPLSQFLADDQTGIVLRIVGNSVHTRRQNSEAWECHALSWTASSPLVACQARRLRLSEDLMARMIAEAAAAEAARLSSPPRRYCAHNDVFLDEAYGCGSCEGCNPS